MELLSPSPPPQPIGDYFAGIVSPPSLMMDFNLKFDPRNFMAAAAAAASTSRLPGEEEISEKVYVAVGKSIERTVSLLHWTFRQFRNREICLLHVHQPSATIPTLLGKLPATQAKEELVTAYREEERERSRKLLVNYLGICFRAKVAARIITIENGQVHKGIVELVNTHGIRNLVMGAVPDNWMKVKKNTCKADYAAKNSPPFCEIWFVNKGKHIWSREATEDMSFPSMLSPPEASLAEQLRSELSTNCKREFILFEPGSPSSPSLSPYATGRFYDEGGNCQMDPDKLDLAFTSGSSHTNRALTSFLNPASSNTASGYTSAEIMTFSGSSSNTEEEILFNKLIEVSREAEKAKDEAFAELLERKRLELQAVETMNKVQAFETAHTREVQLRREVEDALSAIKQEKERLMEQTGEVSGDIQRTMRNVAVLDSRVQEATHRQEKAATELRHIQASLASLRRDKQKIQRQKEELTRRLEQWKNHGEVGELNFDGLGLDSDSEDFTEFSLSDLQAATCNFSESFKVGQGPYGCVYKGEMLDKSIAIKKLHPYNIQGRLEFQIEVQVLRKLQHPHLVTVIGACPEALSLVYEYLPNGSIQDHLFRKNNKHPLNWKTRTCIAAAISSALLFLHSHEPERIIHGDLKPENILLDSDFNCKIGDFAIHRLVPEDNARCPSFGRGTGPSSALPYRDPELRTDGEVTPKSDIYSFGVIILQLLTGRSPAGLASEVRRAVLSGKLVSLLDPLAGEWPTFIARRLVELGLQCCEMNPRDRPELTPALVRELEQLHLAEERPVPSFFLCPILQEIMHDPHVAADGFTYEGEAIRGWLQNGRETSPMTNLKLSHLHLTPNHALQLAIRDWLCQS